MMNDDETLELLARVAILAGRLPRQRIQRIWAGPGEGCACALCGDTVNRGEPGYEFDLTDDMSGPGSPCALHFRCFAAWSNARQRLEGNGLARKQDQPSEDGTSGQFV